jgi:hypothetical protein
VLLSAFCAVDFSWKAIVFNIPYVLRSKYVSVRGCVVLGLKKFSRVLVTGGAGFIGFRG